MGKDSSGSGIDNGYDYTSVATGDLVQYYTVERNDFEPQSLKSMALELARRAIDVTKFNCPQCGDLIVATSFTDAHEAQCQECGAFNPIPAQSLELEEGAERISDEPEESVDDEDAEVAVPGFYFEVAWPTGEKKVYRKTESVEADILAGKLYKNIPSRSYTIADDGKPPKKKPEFAPLEKTVVEHFNINRLYRPIAAYSRQYLIYGAAVGVILKFLDTSWNFFSVSAAMGALWVFFVIALVIPSALKIVFIIGVVIAAASLKVGLLGLFAALITTALVGVIFGGPVGMMVGTIAGHFKKGSFPLAPNFTPEGVKPYLLGLLAAPIFLVVAAVVYFFLIVKLIS
jgi:predicted RNA-binding Zn-ribbon protein involved in translation (DUF1610 family)